MGKKLIYPFVIVVMFLISCSFSDASNSTKNEEETIDTAFTNAVEQIEAPIEDKKRKTITSSTLQSLFPKGLIKLPSSFENFSKILNTTPRTIENANCIDNVFYSWDFENDFNLIHMKMTNNLEMYSIKYFGEDNVKGLPFDLVFNESEANEVKHRLSKFNASIYNSSSEEANNTSVSFLVVEFQKDGLFVQLEFDPKYNKLKTVKIANQNF